MTVNTHFKSTNAGTSQLLYNGGLAATKYMMDLVKYPVITEKTYIALYKNRQYTFDVDKRLTKTQIKKLFYTLFNVDVISVNTHIPPMKSVRVGIKQGFRPRLKRAIITVKENQSIQFNLKGAAGPLI